MFHLQSTDPSGSQRSTLSIRFYEELNDFLAGTMRKQDIVVRENSRRTVKDLIEALGVPHVEVDLILVGGQSVDFNYILQDGDRISVYPMFERLDITGVSRLGQAPLRRPAFVVDNNLGKLARNLRLMGFDVIYDPKLDDEKIAWTAREQKRTILTRDRDLLKRKIVTHGLFVRSTAPTEQLLEVLHRLELQGHMSPLSRCLLCGGMLQSCPAEEVGDQHLIPPCIKAAQHTFYRCATCRKIYWRGRHYEQMQQFVSFIREQLANPT